MRMNSGVIYWPLFRASLACARARFRPRRCASRRKCFAVAAGLRASEGSSFQRGLLLLNFVAAAAVAVLAASWPISLYFSVRLAHVLAYETLSFQVENCLAAALKSDARRFCLILLAFVYPFA